MNKPIFYPQCRIRDTFERQPEKDILSVESGKILWKAWECKLCGYRTINQIERIKESE